MGCDIHFVVEYKNPYREYYIPVYVSDEQYQNYFPGLPSRATPTKGCNFWDYLSDRNYRFFVELAQIRGFPNQGLPSDATDAAQKAFNDGDSHSFGSCSLEDFFNAHAHATEDPGTLAARRLQNLPLSHLQEGFDPRFIGQYRIVYWFDN